MTTRRDGSSHLGIGITASYGTCLSCFGFIPLFVVSTALLEIGSGSQADLVAMCYYNVHDSDYLKEIALPSGAEDVYALEDNASLFSKAMVTAAKYFDRFTEELIDQNMCTEHCPCWAGPPPD